MPGRVLRLPPDVQAAIRAMHPDLKRRIRAALDVLREEPGRGKPLRRELERWWSLRVGTIRIIYRPVSTGIDVALIGPRVTIYLDAARRLRRRR